MDLHTLFIVPHAISGAIALITGIIAVITKIADVKHKWHVWSGRMFFWGMVGVAVTALGLVVVRPNMFLFFITLFSFYHVWAGWRYAKNRKGIPSQLDILITFVALLAFVCMAAWGAYDMFVVGNSVAVVLIIFGILGLVNANRARDVLANEAAKGKNRIAQHLGMMMGGFIASITAFGVVNTPDGASAPLATTIWLLPTAILVPIIFIWTAKIMGGKKLKGMGKKV